MPTQKYSMGTIRIGDMTCDICPTQYDCTLPDGSAGFIHYRHGELNVYTENLHSIANTGKFDEGFISMGEVASWLRSLGYSVEFKN